MLDFLPVPQRSSKPSPSKRRCSSENVEPAEEKNPTAQATKPVLPDPPTDKKPPIVPACARPASSAGATDGQLLAQAQPAALKSVRPMSDDGTAAAPPKTETSGIDDAVPVRPVVPKSADDPMEVGAPPAAAGMKSRLQKLAEQRKCWEGPGEQRFRHFFPSAQH